jgi:hypothetical protein
VFDGFVVIVHGFAFDGDTIGVFFVFCHVDGAEFTLTDLFYDIIIVHMVIMI